jgi:hypothetical protein
MFVPSKLTRNQQLGKDRERSAFCGCDGCTGAPVRSGDLCCGDNFSGLSDLLTYSNKRLTESFKIDTMNKENSGRFVSYQGLPLPW